MGFNVRRGVGEEMKKKTPLKADGRASQRASKLSEALHNMCSRQLQI
jgi:hypothetical protein